MKKRVWSTMGLSFLLAAFALAVVPAQAQNVEDKIKSMEQELASLKAEQMELKKDATAAAAALPTFAYRSGFLGITAADKSWQFSTSFEFHAHMYNHIDGNDARGFTTGDIFLRRFRPYFYYCWDNCLYEIGSGLDLDDGEGDMGRSQTSKFVFHLNKINPYFPEIEISDKGNEQMRFVSRSSARDATVEFATDLLNDEGYDTLSHAGIGTGWRGVKLGTGDFTFWNEMRVNSVNQSDRANSDRKQYFLKVGARPFSQTKNKWLRGLRFGVGFATESLDDRNSNVSRRIGLRTTDRVGRIRIMRSPTLGDGRHIALFPGLDWVIGPYKFLFSSTYSKYNNDGNTAPNSGKSVKGFAWGITNQVFLWSPKGVLTGSSRTKNSLLVGWSFKRADLNCGSGNDCTPGDSKSSKGHLIQRELDVWYFLRPGLSVGAWWNWFSTPNMPYAPGGSLTNNLQEAVGCTNGGGRVGKGCDWHSVNLGLRANY